MQPSLRSRFGIGAVRGAGLLAVALCAASCRPELDTTRIAAPKGTLGDDMYGVLCDRLGGGVLTEDLTGESYHSVCHYDDAGHYGDKVDVSFLPEVGGSKAKEARRLSVAKLETMARRRSDLIRAVNAIFPDIKIADVTQEGKTVRLHDALMSLGSTLTPLYESNPYDENATPLLPQSTQSLGRLFGGLMDSDGARQAMARIWGRQGYRPSRVGLGAIRPALAYPKLRDLTKASVGVLGPDGVAVPQLQQLLGVSKHEMLTAQSIVGPLPAWQLDGATAQPNRPRTNVEVMAAILIAEDPSFAESPNEPSRFITFRDKRGFAVPLGNLPGQSGTVSAPFADGDGDGFADVDAFGRFVGDDGQPTVVPPPFGIPGLDVGPTDAFGRPETLSFRYIDTSRALTGSLARNMVPLFDATIYGTPGAPDQLESEHETMMYALSGAYALYGDRESTEYDYSGEGCDPTKSDCKVQYDRFRAEDSPFPDLLHALGQVLADKDSDAILLSMIDLLENHEATVARLLGAALRVQEIAKQHDALAAQGQEPAAVLPYETPIWDEMAQVLAQIVKRPGLTARLIAALADDAVVAQQGTSKHMGDTVARFMKMRDELTYNQANINGPARNLTEGGASTEDIKNPVDRTQPTSGKNRSCMQRSLQAMYDANHVRACNKQGAVVHAKLFGLDVDWPIVGAPFDECELFQFNNLATFYLDANLPDWHPKKSKLAIKSDALSGIMTFLGSSNADAMLEESSGITGLTEHPSNSALNRLVFFGADSEEYPNMPDYDFVNENSQTNLFVSGSMEPVAPVVCDGQPDALHHCADMPDLFRLRDGNTLFLWERLGFLDYLRPVVMTFVNEGCSDDLSSCDVNNVDGELLFLDLMSVLHHHWAGKEHGTECNNTGTAASNTRYCSEAGVNTYEPLMADAFVTDLVPALNEFAKVASELAEITVERGPDKGQTLKSSQVLEMVTKILFDPDYAASVGMVDRQGGKQAHWVDGTVQPQLTGFTLFTDALHRMDTRFDAAPDGVERKAQWKRARSQLVDQFLAVEGEGPTAKFKNGGMARTMVAVMKVLREQLNANCPSRETGTPCTWAKKDLGDKLASTMSGPLFASMMDLQEQIRLNEPARRELERFLSYIMESASDGDALQATLASMSDMLQVMSDDGSMAPIFQAVANAASRQDDKDGPGCADTTVKMLKAIVDDRYDQYHVLDSVLPLLVTPMDGGAGLTPVEVFIDIIADVHRADATVEGGLDDQDYKFIMKNVKEFMTDDKRGLEQFYYVVQHRPRQ